MVIQRLLGVDRIRLIECPVPNRKRGILPGTRVMNLKLWLKTLLPFIFFVVGFYGTALFVRRETFLVPSVVGLSVSEAVSALSSPTGQLVPRILQEREDSILAPGTVISQLPQAGQRVKSQQCVYLTVSKARQKETAPEFVGKSLAEVKAEADQRGIRLKTYQLPDNGPTSTIVAQVPASGIPLDRDEMAVYVATGMITPLRVVPDLTAQPAAEVKQACERARITLEGADEVVDGDGRVIVAQRPLPGSIVDVTNGFKILVQVG